MTAQRLAQRHAERIEVRRQAVAQAEARRAERIALFDRLLVAAQAAERMAIDRHHGNQNDKEWEVRASAAMDRVWVEQKMLDVVSAPEIRAAVFKFAQKLDHVVWHGPGDAKVWEFLNESRGHVLNAVRADLAALDPQLLEPPLHERAAIAD
jgi:hypothetical protein